MHNYLQRTLPMYVKFLLVCSAMANFHQQKASSDKTEETCHAAFTVS